MAGFRLAKVYSLNAGRHVSKMEWLSTFGYAFLMYEDRYMENDSFGNPAEKARLKSLQTFHIGQGIRFTIDNLGLQLNYNYAPYGQFSTHVSSSFGAHSLSTTLIYKI